MIVAKRITFSLVMPCGPKCDRTVKAAINSILDQDFKDWELICVVNGNWPERKQGIKTILKFAKRDSRITVLELVEGNVCKARNLGAKSSTGEFLSFFSSDFIMYPGALTKWKKEFDGDPEAEFIYSGYALLNNGKPVDGFVPSIPFDPWQLKIGNYIDGGFPMRRIVWEKGKWDENIKSLNDWDFWLTAVDNGFKGKMIPDPTYAAEVPKQGGLSFDSHNNWLERVGQIKKKHNIPERDICVVSLGAQPHGKKLAKILDADFQVAPQMKPNKYKAIYLIGFYIGDGESAVRHSNVFKGFEGKQIIHWVGTDILQLKGAGYKVCYNDLRSLLDSLEKRINLTEFEQSHGELLSVGLSSKIIPLPVEDKYPVTPLPKDFTVAVYVPATPTARIIYNLDYMDEIVKACPDIKFLLFGGGKLKNEHKNAVNVGWKEMDEVINASSCLMRLTIHDGLPITPIEFKLAGRDAITTVPMKYVHFAGEGVYTPENFAQKKEGIVKTLREVKKVQKREGVREMEEARKYYRELCSPENYKKAIRLLVDE